MNRSVWTGFVVESAMIVVLLLVGLVALVLPHVTRRSELRAEIRSVNERIESRSDRITGLSSAASRVRELGDDVRRLAELVKRRSSGDEVSRELRRAARERALLTVLDEPWAPLESGTEPRIRTHTKQMTLIGTFASIVGFLETAETRPYFLAVDEIRLVRLGAGREGEVEAQLVLRLRESASTGAAVEGDDS